MVFISCQASPLVACSGYLTAALDTDHTMMFTNYVDHKDNKWDVLKVTTAKLMIRSNAKDFINDYGAHWILCKCKTERVKECEAMM